MRVLILLCCVAVAIVLATVSPSRGDGEPSEPAPVVADEPTIEAPVEPLPGPREPFHEPFTPYSIGGPEAAWSYEQLTTEEKVVADRGLDEDQTAIQAGYAAATATLAAKATAERAALQLGVDESLEEIGVVP